MSNKDLLKLENEFRDELPVYKEKPKITTIPKSNHLTKKVSEFLANTKDESQQTKTIATTSKSSDTKEDGDDNTNLKHVEMDIFITQ